MSEYPVGGTSADSLKPQPAPEYATDPLLVDEKCHHCGATENLRTLWETPFVWRTICQPCIRKIMERLR